MTILDNLEENAAVNIASPSTAWKRHVSISKKSIRVGLSLDIEPTAELQTYVQHLEGKIDALIRTIENDKTVREELADIKHLLHMNESSYSNESGRDRCRHSPPRDVSDARREAARSKKPTKEFLGPQESDHSEKLDPCRRRFKCSMYDPKMDKNKKSAFKRLGSVSASTTHSVRRSARRDNNTSSPNINGTEVSETQEIVTKGYMERLSKKIRERCKNYQRAKDRREKMPVSERLGPKGTPFERCEGSPHSKCSPPSPMECKRHHTPDSECKGPRKRKELKAYSWPPRKHQVYGSPKGPEQSTRKHHDVCLIRLTFSPFTIEVDCITPPRGFSQPKFVGTANAYTYLIQYKLVMSLFTQEALLCKVFPSSHMNLGLTWFNQLSYRSIRSFDLLCQAFMDWFVTNTEYIMEINSLLGLKKLPRETLHS